MLDAPEKPDNAMDRRDGGDYGALSSAEAAVGRAFSRPKLIAICCLAALTALGWAYLGLMLAGSHGGPVGAHGPGMGILDRLIGALDLGASGAAWIDALCRPSFGAATGAWSGADAALVLMMWVAMVLAMMLPTAGPMVATYADIADTGARKGEAAVSPLVLAAGYVAVWLGFALVATALQGLLARVALIDHAMVSASPLFSGAIFVAAGVYQFSALKHACVTRCQRPFPFFFANWTTQAGGVFRLGLRQGIYCVGCCWAMMMVMFAVGLMNVVWMAGLGLVMTAEKLATTTRFSRVIGAALGIIGVSFIASAVIGHWPSHPTHPM
jgi:predicted metal-binding membrane protein